MSDIRAEDGTGRVYGYEPPLTFDDRDMDAHDAAIAEAASRIGTEPQGDAADTDGDWWDEPCAIEPETAFAAEDEVGYEDEHEYDAYDDDDWSEDEVASQFVYAQTGVSRAAAWAGAISSIALLGGVGVWGYDLAVRDLHGVPVVEALEGPVRVLPDDPGGAQVAHQGLAVNEVPADGAAGAPAEQVALAPPPAELAEEDVAASELAEGPDMADPLELAGVDLTIAPGAQEIADVLSDGVVPLFDSVEDRPLALVPASVPGVSTSLRPAARPARVRNAAVIAPTPVRAAAPAAVRRIEPGSIATGTHLAQVGAFPSADLARTEWTRLSRRFDSLFSDKGQLIVQASSGGSAFYRLRAVGFQDMADARAFCAVLKAENAPCIPVITR